jgi:hypothetical protein
MTHHDTADGHGHAHDDDHAHGHDDHRHVHGGPDGHDHDSPGGLVGRLKHLVAPHSHDAAVAMDSELESSRSTTRAISLPELMPTSP